MKRRIIIDTDPGQDDAVAILLALASPEELDVLGIVAVAGNVPLAHTERNARRIVELAGRPEVPVYAGCIRPMVRALRTAEHVHGRTGLDGADLPDPKVPLQVKHGVDFIIDTLRAAEPGSVTLCTLGPLTDIGVALVKAPDIAQHVREIVMMGGAYFEVGNITPTAEFNIFVDPEAADVVMKSGIPIVMSPLDLTHRMLTTRERLDAFAALGNKSGRTVSGLLSFSERFDLAKYARPSTFQ
jgi:purine nucleosidase